MAFGSGIVQAAAREASKKRKRRTPSVSSSITSIMGPTRTPGTKEYVRAQQKARSEFKSLHPKAAVPDHLATPWDRRTEDLVDFTRNDDQRRIIEDFIDVDEDTGKPKYEKKKIPILRTDDKKLADDQARLKQTLGRLKNRGLADPDLKQLKERGQAEILVRNFKLDKKGRPRTTTVKVPKLKGTPEELQARLQDNRKALTTIRTDKRYRSEVKDWRSEELDKRVGLTDDLKDRGLTRKEAAEDLEPGDDPPIAAAFGGGGGSLSKIARVSRPGVFALMEVLSRPGRAVESGIGKQAARYGLIKGDTAEKIREAPGPLATLFRGEDEKTVRGGDLTQGLFNTRQAGIVADVLTDPLMYTGVGGALKLSTSRAVALASRIEKQAPKLLESPRLIRLAREAKVTANFDTLEQELLKIASKNKIDTKLLGRAGRDRKAIRLSRGDQSIAETTKGILARAAERRGKAPKLSSGRSTYVPDSPGLAAVTEAARAGTRRARDPGFRIRALTPLGNELGAINVRLPKKLAEARFLPAVSPRVQKSLLGARQRTAEADVYRRFFPEVKRIRQELKTARRAGDREKVLELRQGVEELSEKVRIQATREGQEARQGLPGASFQSPKELTGRINRQRFVHELSRNASLFQHNTARQFMGLVDNAVRPLRKNPVALRKVQLHRMMRHDRGSAADLERVAPLDDTERQVLDDLDKIDRQLGEFGQEVGTLDRLVDDYTTRIYQDTGNPFGVPDRTEADRISMATGGGAGGYFQRSRRQFEMSSVSSKHMLAEQVQHIAPHLTMKDANELAEKWFQTGRIRMTAENLARSVQRGEELSYDMLQPVEQQAYQWSRRMASRENNESPLFRDVVQTEGYLKLHPDADRTYGFSQMDDLTDEARAAGVASDRQRLDEAIEAAGGSESDLGQQYVAIRDRLDETGKSYGLEPGEQLLRSEGAGLRTGGSDNPFDPGGRLPDLRDQGKLAVVLDPRASAFYRMNSEGRAAAFRARWKAIDETMGRDIRDATEGQAIVAETGERISAGMLRKQEESVTDGVTYLDETTGKVYSPSELDFPEQTLIPANTERSIFYDVDTGKEFIRPATMDKEVGVMVEQFVGPERLWPTETLRDAEMELLRQGEKGYQALYQSGMESGWRKVSSMIRYGVTVPFPAYHIRNMLADTLKSLQADSGVAFHPLMTAKLTAAAAARGNSKLSRYVKDRTINVPNMGKMKIEDFLLMTDTFGIRSSQHLEEFQRLAETGKFVDAEASAASKLAHSAKQGFGLGATGRGGQALIEAGARREDVARFWTFTQRMRRNGGDAAEAAWFMTKHHFDYGDLTLAERRIMRNVFLFYTWYRKNIPVQMLEILSRPGFFSAVGNTYAALAHGETPINVNWSKINPILPDMSGEVAEPGLIPDYMLAQLGAFTTNWNGHTMAVGFGAPWIDLNLITNIASDPLSGSLQAVSFMNPGITTAAQLIFQKDIITGRDLKVRETSGVAIGIDAMAGALGFGPLPQDDTGKPILPFWLNTILRNVPFAGRASTSLYGVSTTRDQGRLQTLGRELSQISGLNIYVAPKEGKRLDAAYLSLVVGRAAERNELSARLSNEKDPARDAALKRFDEETEKWAKQHGIDRKYLKAVQGIGPAYQSKSDSGPFGGSDGSSSAFGGGGSQAFQGYNLGVPGVGPSPQPVEGGPRLAQAMNTLRADEGKADPKPPEYFKKSDEPLAVVPAAVAAPVVPPKKAKNTPAQQPGLKANPNDTWTTDEAATLLYQVGATKQEAQFLSGFLQSESGGNPKAVNPTSFARGLFQHITSQGGSGGWDEVPHKADPSKSVSQYYGGKGVPEDFNDPVIAARSALYLLREAGPGQWEGAHGAEGKVNPKATQGVLETGATGSAGSVKLWKGKAKGGQLILTPETKAAHQQYGGLTPEISELGKTVSAAVGEPLTLISGHRVPGGLTNSGNVSDHGSGNAIDIDAINDGGAGTKKGDAIAVAAVRAAGGTPEQERAIVSGVEYVNIETAHGRVQVIWKDGGDHENHVHVGYSPTSGSGSSVGGAAGSGGAAMGGTGGTAGSPGTAAGGPVAPLTPLDELNEKGIGTPYGEDEFPAGAPADFTTPEIGDYGLTDTEDEPEIDDTITVKRPRYRLNS